MTDDALTPKQLKADIFDRKFRIGLQALFAAAALGVITWLDYSNFPGAPSPEDLKQRADDRALTTLSLQYDAQASKQTDAQKSAIVQAAFKNMSGPAQPQIATVTFTPDYTAIPPGPTLEEEKTLNLGLAISVNALALLYALVVSPWVMRKEYKGLKSNREKLAALTPSA